MRRLTQPASVIVVLMVAFVTIGGCLACASTASEKSCCTSKGECQKSVSHSVCKAEGVQPPSFEQTLATSGEIAPSLGLVLVEPATAARVNRSVLAPDDYSPDCLSLTTILRI